MSGHFRFQLARRAFNKACDRLETDRDAGRISAADAVVQFKKLHAAYRARKEDLELAAFLAKHGLRPSKHFEKLDRTLTELAVEHNENRVGNTPITTKHAA